MLISEIRRKQSFANLRDVRFGNDGLDPSNGSESLEAAGSVDGEILAALGMTVRSGLAPDPSSYLTTAAGA